MPGNVVLTAPATVLPQSLSTSFVHSREYPMIANDYRNGENQRRRQADTSRKSWVLGKRLTSSQLQTLRDFYEARKGEHQPFYFYDPWDTSPKFSYDATGATVVGRYTVRFQGGWSQTCDLRRSVTEIQLVEVA